MAQLRIALLGVPGSGKSALAETLTRAIERVDIEDGCDCRTPVKVIDNYVKDVEEQTALATGFMADYVANLHIALHREALERTTVAKTLITCGTLIETATYTTIDGIAQLRIQDEDERLDTVKRIEATMKTLACLYMDTFHYDHAFYLPPLSVTGDEEQVKLLDRHLQTAFQAFNLVPVTPLMTDSADPIEVTAARCDQALRQIIGVPVAS